VSDVCRPYLGTVLAALDPGPVQGLASALTATAAQILADGDDVDALVVEEAGAALNLPVPLAVRYLLRLKAPSEGLVVDGLADLASIRTLVDLRRRYGPPLEGDPFAAALEPDSGLRA
jgi:hypothetical protein